MDGGRMKSDGAIVVTDVPELADRVELVEGTVGDALRLMDMQRAGNTGIPFIFECLAISLRLDGKRLSVEELHALPMHCLSALLRLGNQALEVNKFFPADDEEEEAAPAEPVDPKS